jgi:hypothetical protein
MTSSFVSCSAPNFHVSRSLILRGCVLKTGIAKLEDITNTLGYSETSLSQALKNVTAILGIHSFLLSQQWKRNVIFSPFLKRVTERGLMNSSQTVLLVLLVSVNLASGGLSWTSGFFYGSLLLIPCLFVQSIHQPTNAPNKTRFMTSIRHLHVSAPESPPEQRNTSQHAKVGVLACISLFQKSPWWTCIPLFWKNPCGWHSGAETCRSLILVLNSVLFGVFFWLMYSLFWFICAVPSLCFLLQSAYYQYMALTRAQLV